ncbi:MAG: NYN domain-containing protein [Anaerolineae bacterium]
MDLTWVPNNTPGKNSVDIALVIEAMSILCTRNEITGYCIVSSDSDYT